MSNKIITKPTKESGLYKVGYKHEDGGIAVLVDGVKPIEVEVKEYKICSSFWNNDNIFEFKQKTNLEILDELFKENNCVFETQSAKSQEFILCRLVVLDPKKYDRKGTCKSIINEMQAEKSCNVTEDAKEDFGQKKQGGTLSVKEESEIRLEVLKRMQRKKPTKELANKIRALKSDIRKGIYKPIEEVKKEEPKDYVPELIATHNLDYSNLLFADKLGGISMPSLAIVRITNPLAYHSYGGIVLVASKDFIDPEKNKSSKVFNRDIYSPTYPKVYSHVDKSALNKLESSFYAKRRDWSIYADEATRYGMSEFLDNLAKGQHLPNLLNEAVKNSFIVYLWAKENGVEIDIPVERYATRYWSYEPNLDNSFVTNLQDKYPVLYAAVLKDVYDYSNEELQKQLADAFKENYIKKNIEKQEDKEVVIAINEILDSYFDKGLLNHNIEYSVFKELTWIAVDKKRVNTDAWRENVERVSKENEHAIREFLKKLIDKVLWGSYFFRTKTSKAETSLDNIYDYMLGRGMKSAEKTMVFGKGNPAALSAKQYDTLPAVARDKDHYTLSREDFEAYKKHQDELWDNVVDKIRQYYKYDNGFDALDSLSKSMGQIAQFKNPTDDKISSILSKNDYGKTPSYVFDVAREYADCLRNAPAEYFEVKMKDIVKIESFIGAAVPNHLAEDVVPLLKKHGITNIALYDTENYSDKQHNLSEALYEIVGKTEKPILFKNGGCLCEQNNDVLNG